MGRAKSRENMELAKLGIELWNRGDMDALRERYHPEAVIHHPQGWPEPDPSVGREAILDQLRRLREDTETDGTAVCHEERSPRGRGVCGGNSARLCSGGELGASS